MSCLPRIVMLEVDGQTGSEEVKEGICREGNGRRSVEVEVKWPG